MRRSTILTFCIIMFGTVALSRAGEDTKPNTLSEAESRAGWKLLFDGKSFDGWRNYRKERVSDGWQIVDGEIRRVSGRAGDLITTEKYGSFELSIEFKIAPGGNSGLMFHVTEESNAPWHTGPEIQILDNAKGKDPQKTGWLYQLYSSSVDATRPAGEWNQIHLRIAPDLCETNLNGVRYYRFVMGNADWNRRVADSKFAKYPNFGKAKSGYICLQDHGNEVAFRNIKIRELGEDGSVRNPIDGELPIKAVQAFEKLQWNDWSPVDDSGRMQPLRPIVLTHAGDGSDRIFVATQRGVIHAFPNDQNAEATKVFLDMSKKVVYDDRQNEEGFLGLAFHPNYEKTGEFFVYYTTTEKPRTSVVSRFRVSKDEPDRADPNSEEELLRIDQPFWNHNGGTIEFGPDGYLYIGLGDGGAANDPHENGQNLGTWLGSILRIDVDRKAEGKNYAIPKDNPFVDTEGAKPEIYAYGFRNVWRFSFDRKTGSLWAADVGQNLWEEINIVRAGGNYGWNLREATNRFGSESSAESNLIAPIWEYDHEVGKSITGGVVYRGNRLPELDGYYLYADYVTGRLWALKYDEENQRVVSNQGIASEKLPVISYGEDEAGEVYFMVVSASGRGIYRFERTKP